MRFIGAFFALLLSVVIASAQSNVVVNFRNSTSTTTQVSSGNPLPVSGTFTPSGTQTVNLGQVLGTAISATNGAFVTPTTAATWAVTGQAQGQTTAGQTGFLGLMSTTTSAPTYTNATANAFNSTTAGALRIDLSSLAGTATVSGGLAGSLAIGGTVATNVAISANPVNLGAQAVSSENTAVTTARQVQLVADLVGKLIVLPYSNPENFVSGVTAAMTSTTSTSILAAPAAGLRNYVTHLVCTNSHATVSTFVLVQDGSGGTTIYEAYAVAVGGGFSLTLPTPLRQPTTATAIFVQNVTTGSNVICSASGYKGA